MASKTTRNWASYFFFERVELAGDVRVGRQQLPHPHEHPHDLDVDPDRPLAPEDTGKHGDTLFGEGVGLKTHVASGCGHNL
jgi:hypothetical protein